MLCITGNGLKTTDVLTDKYVTEEAIRPRLADFEAFLLRAEHPAQKIPETIEA